MLVKNGSMTPERTDNPAGGCGSLFKYQFLGKDLCPDKLGFVAKIVLEKGAAIGDHLHSGDGEIWYYLEGTGEYTEDGVRMPVGSGDLTICYSGSSHAIRNTGDAPLTFLAIKFFS